jgi:hypothetical protein
MMMLMGVRLKGRFDSAQAGDPAQLSAHHRHEMLPAFERFVVGVIVMALDDFPKLPSINRLEQLPKDAIHVSHARPFSVSRQPESIRFTLDLPGMRCGIVNHSRDSPGHPEGEKSRLRAFSLAPISEPNGRAKDRPATSGVTDRATCMDKQRRPQLVLLSAVVSRRCWKKGFSVGRRTKLGQGTR